MAKRGTRPRAPRDIIKIPALKAGVPARRVRPRDTRYKWSYIFGGACPGQGKTAGLILPYVNAEAMQLHLAEIAKAVSPGSPALLIMDAGWHGAKALTVPDNITILKLPPYAPALNPMENRLGLSAIKQTRHHCVRYLRPNPRQMPRRLELLC